MLGRISGVYGVKGWVRVHSYTDPRDAILGYAGWLLGNEQQWRDAHLEEGRKHGNAIIAKLAGVDDREVAATLLGTDVAVRREALPATADGEYYWTDLEGMRVVREDGAEIGRVAYMLATGDHDVMVVQGEREVLIPFVTDRIVKDVDLAGGVISVDWDWE